MPLVKHCLIAARYYKYIATVDTIVVFNKELRHVDVAKTLSLNPVSAGFVDKYEVYGESDTLGLKSDPSLTDIIVKELF